MRIRTVKPEFFTHESLFELEQETKLPIRLAFIGLWCAADKAGRFKWEPRRLGVAVMPYDGHDFSRVLDALTTRGFVVKYRVNGALFGAIPSFNRHQVINNREKESELPDPSTGEACDATTTRAPRVPHAGKEEGKGREGEGEGTGKDLAPAGGEPSAPVPAIEVVRAEASGPHAEFARLWTEEYPKHHAGMTYAFQGAKDGSAIKALLSTSKLQPVELQAVFVAAWKNPKGFHCKLAASICGFNSKFNEIREELRTLGASSKPVTTFALTSPGPKGWQP